jgi:thymidylate synthase (FAD)
MRDDFYVPEPEQVRIQSKTNRQGGEEPIDAAVAHQAIKTMAADQKTIYEHYEAMIGQDIARELARINLPLSLYTEWYWQIDLHNLFHFIGLRTDVHAQYEIRLYAEAMAKCARAVAPIAYEAFEEYALHAKSFAASEMEALRAMARGEKCPIDNERRREEFFAKLGVKDEKDQRDLKDLEDQGK